MTTTATGDSNRDVVHEAIMDLMFAGEDAGETDIVQMCVMLNAIRTAPQHIRRNIALLYADFGHLIKSMLPTNVKG